MLNVFLSIYFNKYVLMYKNSRLGINSICKMKTNLSVLSVLKIYFKIWINARIPLIKEVTNRCSPKSIKVYLDTGEGK